MATELEYKSSLTFHTGTVVVSVGLVIVYSCVASLYKPIRSDDRAVPAKGEEYLHLYVRRVEDEKEE